MKYAFFSERKNLNFFLSYIFGIMIGTVVFNCLDMTEKNNIYIYYDYVYNRVSVKELMGIEYFKHVFLYRFKEILLLLFFGLTRYKNLFYNGFLAFYGIKISLLMCVISVLKGKLALLFFPLLLFPHIIFQAIIICQVLKGEMFNYTFNSKVFKSLGKIFIILLCVVFCEAIINPIVVNKIF